MMNKLMLRCLPLVVLVFSCAHTPPARPLSAPELGELDSMLKETLTKKITKTQMGLDGVKVEVIELGQDRDLRVRTKYRVEFDTVDENYGRVTHIIEESASLIERATGEWTISGPTGSNQQLIFHKPAVIEAEGGTKSP